MSRPVIDLILVRPSLSSPSVSGLKAYQKRRIAN
jgi:hypothetical protein